MLNRDCVTAQKDLTAPKMAAIPAAVYREAPQLFDDLMRAFSEGFEPDLNDPNQHKAFLLYRILKFGDPQQQIPHDADAKVAAVQVTNPNLGKRPLSRVEVTTALARYAACNSLTKLAQPLSSALEPYIDTQKSKGHWEDILRGEVPPRLLGGAGQSEFNAENLWNVFRVRWAIIPEGEKGKKIAQAMVDLVNAHALLQRGVLNGLQSENGHTQLSAFQAMLSTRIEFQNGFRLSYIEKANHCIHFSGFANG